MTISSTTSRISYAGNGVTTIFSFPYYFLAEADLIVVSRDDTTGVETAKVLTTDYTVSGEGEQAGGSVTMLIAPATGTTLVIYRDPAATQGLDLVANDALPVENVEEALDKLTMLVQRLIDVVSRSVSLSDGFSPTFDPTLPIDLDSSGGRVPLINDDGDGFALAADWPSASDIEDAEENAAAAAASAAAAAASAAAAATTVMVTTGTSSAPTSLVAGTALTVQTTTNQKKYIQGSGGAVDVSANPQIGPGDREGQWLLLVGCSDTNTVKYENGTGLSLNGPMFMKQNDCLWLNWDNTAALWVEVARREN